MLLTSMDTSYQRYDGVIELDKLQVIHLFEADFNLLIRVYFGRRAMHHQVD
jgi:hypothetical protein